MERHAHMPNEQPTTIEEAVLKLRVLGKARIE
jgi:hypothetical protein